MEKKVPERKVSLREEDIFYVYDKRINKCIKEDCEGTVKYGLVLRVSMTGEETCNCYECNKCHMKYTPYPNYVRLTKTDMLTIYNKEEVEARDRKRAEDAQKQAAKEKRKQQGRNRFTPRRDSEPDAEGRTFERRPFERRSYDKKPYERKSYGNNTYERKPYERKPYERKNFDKKPYEKKEYGMNSYGNSSYERKPYGTGAYEKKPYERKSYGTGTYEKKPYERKPYDTEGAEKRTYEKKAYGERRNSSVIITNGNYRRPYTNKQS